MLGGRFVAWSEARARGARRVCGAHGACGAGEMSLWRGVAWSEDLVLM